MSATRKAADRPQMPHQYELSKCQWQKEILKATLQKTTKRKESLNGKKSKEKTIKILPQRNRLTDNQSSKMHKTSKYYLDRSKESKESKESLVRSTQSYYILQGRGKRSDSAKDKHVRSHKSKELTNASNLINNTFQMQSMVSTHKKKQSNFSSTVGSHFQMLYLNRSALSPAKPKQKKQNTLLASILLKSETVLEQYKTKNELLQKENRRYKKKYRDALKKLKHLESKS